VGLNLGPDPTQLNDVQLVGNGNVVPTTAQRAAGVDARAPRRPGPGPAHLPFSSECGSVRPLKTIVCFGDSNTYGHIPGSDGKRYARDVRWPARLATALANEAEVISEGLSGRTATIESPVAEGRNGLPYLVPCLRSHAPVDILVIYLGTNDAYWLEPLIVANSIGRLIKAARAAEAGPDRGAPQILVVCPPPFGGHELAASYREMCAALGCELLDLDGIAPYSPIDGTHLDEPGHIAVADAVEARIRRILA